MTDLVKAISPKSKVNFIGIRPGEKIHEEMITSSDSFSTFEFDNHFKILPSDKISREKYERNGITNLGGREIFKSRTNSVGSCKQYYYSRERS